MEVVKETAITTFSHEIGMKYLTILYAEIYNSGTFQLLMLLALVGTLVMVGIALHNRKFPEKIIMFAVALAFTTPYNGTPAGFVVVDSLSAAIAAVMESATAKFVANSANTDEATNMHPNLVMEAIAAASSTQVESKDTRNKFIKFMGKCGSQALRENGQKAEFNDFFDFRVTYQVGLGGLQMTFEDRILDQRSLANNDAISESSGSVNCLDALTDLRKSMIDDLEGEPLSLRESVIYGMSGNNEENMKTTARWFENWKSQRSPFLDIARNLRVAMAAEYEKSKMIGDASFWQNNYYESTRMDASLRELMLGIDSQAMELGFASSNIGELPARLTGSRWAASLGAAIKDLKEKIELAPYYLVGVKNTLRILAVFAILMLFTSKAYFFWLWAAAWFTSCIIPSAITAHRAINNSIILSKLGIQDIVNSQSAGNKALAYGVDISQAKLLLDEYIPLAYGLINQELAVIGFLSTTILAGSFIAGMMGNGAVGWMASSVKGYFLNRATHGATEGAGKIAGSVAPAAGGVAAAAYQRFVPEKATPSPSLSHPSGPTGYTLGGIFPKEKS